MDRGLSILGWPYYASIPSWRSFRRPIPYTMSSFMLACIKDLSPMPWRWLFLYYFIPNCWEGVALQSLGKNHPNFKDFPYQITTLMSEIFASRKFRDFREWPEKLQKISRFSRMTPKFAKLNCREKNYFDWFAKINFLEIQFLTFLGNWVFNFPW